MAEARPKERLVATDEQNVERLAEVQGVGPLTREALAGIPADPRAALKGFGERPNREAVKEMDLEAKRHWPEDYA